MGDKDLMQEAENYVLRYGGMCRDCADENGVCPSSGIVCDVEQRRKMVRRTLEALDYGSRHGFMLLPFAAAISAAHEAGRREEREACAVMLESAVHTLRLPDDPQYDGDERPAIKRVVHGIAAAIRSREVKP